MLPCLFVGREAFATDQFDFEYAEERLAHRVIIRIDACTATSKQPSESLGVYRQP
jgi:hypothetical protein